MSTQDTVAIEREALQRRTVRVLLLSQVFAGAGLAAGVSVGALLAQDMLNSTGSSGLPTALFTLGSAVAAMLVGRISQASGRRSGLAAGYAVGAVGGAGVVLAAAIDSVPLLFAALLLYGSGTATNLQARYAGGDLVPKERRARAMSTILVATTLGAVVGPNLVDVMGSVAESFGIRTLAGPFILATVAYALAAIAVVVLLRPDPLLAARRWAADEDAARPAGTAKAVDVYAPRTVILAGTAMVLTQMVMVAIMTMTPVHMHEHGHGLGASGLVISVHIAAMYLPSPLSGYLVDRHGHSSVLGGAGLALLSAGLVAALAPAGSTALLALGLALLGFGWSLGLAAGSAMVTDAAPLERRARIQGQVDVSVAIAGATGGLASGYVMDATGYPTLSIAGGVLALLLLPIMIRVRAERLRPTPA
jgi:MFS family permease